MARASTATGLKPNHAVSVGGVRLTDPDKVLFAEQGMTKSALADYYRAIAPWILPHAAGRPLGLVRGPADAEKNCFYETHVGRGASAGLEGVATDESDGATTCGLVSDPASLIGLVQLGALEIHAANSRADDVEHPDRLVFDLDPDPALPWHRMAAAAILLRDDLAAMGFQSFVMTTGGTGLHVVVPIGRRHGWGEVEAFARAFATAIVDEVPHLYTLAATKPERAGKVFIEILRNDRGATSVVPYSTRARIGAPVATPLAWGELRSNARPQFSLATIPGRLARLAVDPWADIDQIEQVITSCARKALRL